MQFDNTVNSPKAIKALESVSRGPLRRVQRDKVIQDARKRARGDGRPLQLADLFVWDIAQDIGKERQGHTNGMSATTWSRLRRSTSR